MNYFSFKGKNNFWFSCIAFKCWVFKFIEFFRIDKNDINSFLKLINDSAL